MEHQLISACIIGKDEGTLLPQCLESIKDLCDEIVFFDTGSTDRTPEIAESYGCKMVEVDNLDEYFIEIDGEMRPHFSKMRNRVFEDATGDWYLIIDCDEKLLNFDINPQEFKKRLADILPGVGALVFTINEEHNGSIASWLGMRLIRASANPYYENYVHNKLKCEGLAAGTDIQLMHYGYHLPPDKMEQKRARTKDLLLKRIEEDENDYNAYYYLCQIAQGDKQWQDSVDYGRKCFELLPISDPEDMQYYATLYFWVANSYIRLWVERSEDQSYDGIDGGNAKQWILQGLEFFPDDVDLNYCMVMFSCMSLPPDKESAIRAAKKYFSGIRRQRNRKIYDTDKFFNYLKKEDFIPRTIYCIGDSHKQDVIRWIKNIK